MRPRSRTPHPLSACCPLRRYFVRKFRFSAQLMVSYFYLIIGCDLVSASTAVEVATSPIALRLSANGTLACQSLCLLFKLARMSCRPAALNISTPSRVAQHRNKSGWVGYEVGTPRTENLHQLELRSSLGAKAIGTSQRPGIPPYLPFRRRPRKALINAAAALASNQLKRKRLCHSDRGRGAEALASSPENVPIHVLDAGMLDVIRTILAATAIAVTLTGVASTMPIPLRARLALAIVAGAWAGLAAAVAGAGGLRTRRLS